MTHIETARSTAADLEDIEPSHPAYLQLTLRGILHALLAIHDQSAPQAPAPRAKTVPATAPRATRAPKESK